MSDRFRNWYLKLKENRKLLRAAAAILVIAAAVFFFGGNGKSDTILLPDSGNAGASEETKKGGGQSEAVDASSAETEEKRVYVDVGGAVKAPGVYELKEGARLFEAVKRAGGMTEKADPSSVNQAEKVRDGQKILIPEKGAAASAGTEAGAGAAGGGVSGSAAASAGDQVNINTADAESLQKLPGVGPATAKKIIDYRSRNGAFQRPEDLMKVSGIGAKTYAKMAKQIVL